jgi:hypothetical protein
VPSLWADDPKGAEMRLIVTAAGLFAVLVLVLPLLT